MKLTLGKVFDALNNIGLLHLLNDEQFERLAFRVFLGKKLDLKNPRTFNEKLQWLKLYYRKPEYTMMVDKYEVKDYVARLIGEEYIIPTLGVWDRFEDIDFSMLPDQFVLKCTHDSGGLVICKDKRNLDIETARKKIERCLKSNFYFTGREWPYKNVKPRIIAEKYISENQSDSIKDYKFFCFGGQVKCFKIDFDRFTEHHANYYDISGQILDVGENTCSPNLKKGIILPETLTKMMELSEILTKDVPFLRADFYSVDGSIYFGELTFYPNSGFGSFTSEEFDVEMGKWINLPGGGNYYRQ